jgi:ATP-dependent RNA helicase DDX55/SPB4
VADINWEDAGKAWGLLKLPKMPEIKSWEGDKSLGVEMDFGNYAYKDKQKEQVRTQEMQDRDERVAISRPPQGLGKLPEKRAWSKKLDQKDTRELRRTKKQKKRQLERLAQMTPEELEKHLELQRLIEDVKKRGPEEESPETFEGFAD